MLDAAPASPAPSAPARCPHGVLVGRFCGSCHVACEACGGSGETMPPELGERAAGCGGLMTCGACGGSGAERCSCCRERLATHLCAEDGDRPWCDDCEIECAEELGDVTHVRRVA